MSFVVLPPLKRSLRLVLCLLTVTLAWPGPALAAYNANDESKLKAAGAANDPQGNLNWNSSPADNQSWTGVTWKNVLGEDRVDSILVHYMRLTGNLNLSNMSSLTYLNVWGNNLSALDVTANTALATLWGWGNNLSTLDVSANTALTDLRVDNNNLSALDVSANTALTHLEVSGNNLGALDVSANTALTDLFVSWNNLSTLDVSANTALTYLDVRSTTLSTLDVSANTALTRLYVDNNNLTTLDVTANTALTYLGVGGNNLSALDVTANTALTYLGVSSNTLSTLDVSANTALTDLFVSNNSLSALDVSANTALTALSVSNNRLPLSQLARMRFVTDLSLGTQTNVVLPAFGSSTLEPGKAYDLSSEARFSNTDTSFTLNFASGGAAVAGVNYRIDNGMLVFLDRDTYTLHMTNSAVTSKGFYGNSAAQVSTGVLPVLPPGSTVYWSGHSSGLWDTQAGNKNWQVNTVAIPYFDSDKTIFNAQGARAVSVDAAGVRPGDMQVEAHGYTFSGGRITGGALSLVSPSPATTVFSNPITFTTGITVAPGNTLVLEHADNHAATAKLHGKLIVGSAPGSGAALAANLNVGAGATLAGHGSITGAVRIGKGGTLSPGNSYGTTTVNGDLTLARGSFYEVEVDRKNTAVADKTEVSGKARLAGTLRHIATGGAAADYAASGKKWLILTAAQGVQGAFDAAVSDLAFLSPELAYKPTSVLLSFRYVPFRDYAVTYNQKSVARALESLDRSSVLYRTIISSVTADQARQMLDGLSGEIHSSLAGNLHLLDSGFLRSLSQHQSRVSLFRNPLFLSASPYPGNGVPPSEGDFATASGGTLSNNLWVNVGGSYTAADSTGNAARSTMHGPEVSGGYDRYFQTGFFGGLAFRYSYKDMDLNSRDSDANLNSYTAALYGGKELPLGPGTLRLTATGAYTRHDIDSTRNLRIAATRQSLSADYSADSFLLSLEAAYLFSLNDKVFLEPFILGAWNNLHIDGFSEHGGTAALRKSSRTHDNAFSSLGLRASLPAYHRVALHGELAWQHTFGTLVPKSTFAFRQGGDSFSIKGNSLNRDEVTVGVGVQLAITKALSLDLSYQGALGNNAQTHGGAAKLKLEW